MLFAAQQQARELQLIHAENFIPDRESMNRHRYRFRLWIESMLNAGASTNLSAYHPSFLRNAIVAVLLLLLLMMMMMMMMQEHCFALEVAEVLQRMAVRWCCRPIETTKTRDWRLIARVAATPISM
jgi:prolipoprotein diacylglyceryltransferase